MAGRNFCNPRPARGLPNGTLDDAFVRMVPAALPGFRKRRARAGRELDQMLDDGIGDARRQYGDPVFAPLAITYADFASGNIDILHSQLGHLHESQPGPVHQRALMSHTDPLSLANSAATSSRDRTAGNRTGRFARTIPASHSRRVPRTSL